MARKYTSPYREVVRERIVTALAELDDRLLGFQEHYEQVAKPFEWKFTRRDLRRLLSKLDGGAQDHRLAA
jgi:hypothetical protein